MIMKFDLTRAYAQISTDNLINSRLILCVSMKITRVALARNLSHDQSFNVRCYNTNISSLPPFKYFSLIFSLSLSFCVIKSFQLFILKILIILSSFFDRKLRSNRQLFTLLFIDSGL